MTNAVIENMVNRRSIRKYKEDKISKKSLIHLCQNRHLPYQMRKIQ